MLDNAVKARVANLTQAIDSLKAEIAYAKKVKHADSWYINWMENARQRMIEVYYELRKDVL